LVEPPNAIAAGVRILDVFVLLTIVGGVGDIAVFNDDSIPGGSANCFSRADNRNAVKSAISNGVSRITDVNTTNATSPGRVGS
jgi:hypothetical protein